MNLSAATICLLLSLSIEGPYQRAVAAFQRGQFQEVLALLDSLHDEEKHRVATINLRAVTLAQLHRLDEALVASEQLTRLDPANPNYISNLGLIYLAKNDLLGAEAIFRPAVQRFPESSRLHEGWGETLLAMNHFQESAEELRTAVELDPTSAEAEVGLAKLFYTLGDNARFSEAASRAIQLHPQNPVACYYYGKHLIEDQQQFAEGAQYVRKSVELSPTFVEGLIEWGVILSREGHWGEAADAYEKALAIDTKNLRVCYLLYRASRKSGRAERAAWALQKYQILSNRP